MSTFGLCSVTFRQLSVTEIIERAKRGNLRAIEWGSDVHVPPDNLKNAERVGKLTRDAGLLCPSYGSYFRCGDEDFLPYARAAEALGAETIRVWAGEQEYSDGAAYEAFVGRVRACCAIAASRGQTVAFEFHHGTLNRTATNTLKLLRDVGCENLKTYWQPMYWFEASEEENLQSIYALQGKIANVHVYCWRGGERLPLADGANEWRKFTAAIGETNYYLEFVRDNEEGQFYEDCETLTRRIGHA